MTVRPYHPDDYEAVATLYQNSELYGGQFDQNRDSAERLRKRTEADPDAILVAERNGDIVGTVSLVEDARVAWLFRFAVLVPHEVEVTRALYDEAVKILRARGHTQVLVYTPTRDENLNGRYETLGLNRGGDYSCYWQDI